MQKALDSIQERNLTEEQRKLVLNYIGLLTYNGDFETGLRALEEDSNAKNLLEQIFKETNDNKRHNLLFELYANRPNRRKVGGKYKMKKSKKSKSKTTKATPKKAKSTKKPKKAKSTKKPKTTRTQTKSYNNPKYKNQDGGFVRGGVLFPESFYRSDIVM